MKLLKQGQLSTVAFLDGLPQVQHDTSSFQVDVSRAEIGGATVITICLTIFWQFTVDTALEKMKLDSVEFYKLVR